MSEVQSQRRERKALVEELVQAALRAVDPAEAVRSAVRCDEAMLRVGDRAFDLKRYRRVFVVGGGKAAAPMAQAVESLLGDRLSAGVVAVRRGHQRPAGKIRVLEAGHPLPDKSSVSAALDIVQLLADATAADLVICLLSGGASSILALPAHDISLEDKAAVTASLLRSGATINELNSVRKHLSRIKGGGLAQLAAPATVLSLILSDVVGNSLDVIASGPTAADPSTFADSYSVLEKYDLVAQTPSAVVNRLQDGIVGLIPETPKEDAPVFANTHNVIIGSNEVAARAALAVARARQMNTLLLSTYVEGEAREAGRLLAGIAKEMAHSGSPLAPPACLVAGGETTVTVRGQGVGGRNQELALAAGLQLAGWKGVAVASVGTDGSDGPTEAAGAYADGDTVSAARSRGIDPLRALSENDSHSLFAALDDLIVTGPTNTNVNDLMFVLAF